MKYFQFWCIDNIHSASEYFFYWFPVLYLHCVYTKKKLNDIYSTFLKSNAFSTLTTLWKTKPPWAQCFIYKTFCEFHKTACILKKNAEENVFIKIYNILVYLYIRVYIYNMEPGAAIIIVYKLYRLVGFCLVNCVHVQSTLYSIIQLRKSEKRSIL